MLPLIILSGPTASGKSNAAQTLAEHLDTEIISADSMLVYKYFDIGTAKPGAEERARVRHHLIDILEPEEEFTAFEFKEKALKSIRDIRSRQKIPVLVGGTGLYLKTLLENRDCAISVSPEIRDQVQKEILQKGTHHMHAELTGIDPVYAGKIEPTDPVRIGRALSVHRATGRRLSDFHAEDAPAQYEFESYLFVLEPDRAHLYEQIDQRVDVMIDRGLKAEVESLLNRGYASQLKPFQSIGYSHMIRHLEDNQPFDQTVHEIKRDTRHFAKRQLTWFRKMADRLTLPMNPGETAQQIKEKILARVPTAAALLIAACLALATPHTANAASEGWFQSGVHEYRAGQWDKARGLLEKLLLTGVDSKTQKRARTLLAKIYIHQKNYTQAKALLQKVLTHYPEMEDYLRLYLAQVHQDEGEWDAALQQTSLILKKFPHTLLIPETRILRADIFEELGDFPKAIENLKQAEQMITRKFSTRKWKAQIPEIVNRQIKLWKLMKDFDQVYALYRKVYIQYPQVAARLQARLQMDQMEQNMGIAPRPLSHREMKRRIRALLGKVAYPEVIQEIEALQVKLKNTPIPASLYFYLSAAHKGLRDRPQANRALRDFLKKYPNHPRADEAHFLIAGNLWNLGNPVEALSHIETLFKSHPKSRWVPEALYYQGRIYEDIKTPTLALEAYQTLIKEHFNELQSEMGGWRSGWIHYKSGLWMNAYFQFKENLRLFEKGQLTDKNLFWMAKTAEKLERNEEAAELYQQAAEKFPFTYYGLQAQNHLNEISPDAFKVTPPFQKTSLEKPSKTKFKQPGRRLSAREKFHFDRARELIELGFFAEAQIELLRLGRSIRKNYSGVIWLSHWYNRAKAYSSSMQILQLLKDLKTIHGEKKLPREFWVNFYPSAYSNFVQTEAAKYDLDPWLVEGLIRQESSYNAQAVSPAGARGLMQIMPKTGKRLYAKARPEDTFQEDLLHQPDINIELGVQYLNDLALKYKSNGVHILISYNAGPKVLKAWMSRFRNINDTDVFIESIPFPETRGYVKHVFRNYGIYKHLYPDHPGTDSEKKSF